MAESFHSLKRGVTGKSTKDSRPSRGPPMITWTHVWPSDQVKTALAQSPFGFLPIEVILQIFKHLSVHDLGHVSLVCRSFKMIADQDEIWKLKCNCKCHHVIVLLDHGTDCD
jgi:F-box-like